MSKRFMDSHAETDVDAAQTHVGDGSDDELTGEWEPHSGMSPARIGKMAGLALVAFLAAVGAGVLVVGGLGMALNFLMLQGPPVQVQVKTADSEGSAAPSEGVVTLQEGTMHELGHFVINLLDPGKTHYATCRIELELDSPLTAKEVGARHSKLKDATISVLGNRTYQELMGQEGKAELREELARRYNRLLTTGKVRRIYFTEFVVQ